MSGFTRCSISLPADVVFQLDYCAGKLQLSRSAFLSGLLSESLPHLVGILGTLPSDPTLASSSDSRRFRGAAADAISDQIGKIIRSGGQGDIFGK